MGIGVFDISVFSGSSGYWIAGEITPRMKSTSSTLSAAISATRRPANAPSRTSGRKWSGSASKQTGSTEQGTVAFAASKEALIQQLTATGQLTPAIQALIDKYYSVPPVVKTKVDMDADAALQRVQSLKAWMDSLTSKTVVVTVQTNAVGAPVGYAAAPGTGAKKYADGGTVSGPGGPKSDSVSAWLSVGEEVTPNPHAGRYRPVLKALARDDVAGASAALGGAGGNTYVTHKWYVTASDPTELTQKVAMKFNALGAA